MKKFFLPFIFLITLSACGRMQTDETKPNLCINSAFSVNYMQGVYSAVIKADANGSMTAEITNPENLKDVSFRCTPEGMTVKCGELELDCADGYYPFSDLYKALNFARLNVPASSGEKGNETELVYENGKEKYFILVDTETGTVNRIQTPLGEYIKR